MIEFATLYIVGGKNSSTNLGAAGTEFYVRHTIQYQFSIWFMIVISTTEGMVVHLFTVRVSNLN
jgi:hypothetical protein